MLVKRIAACAHLSSTVYELQRDIGRKLKLFPIPLHLTARPRWECSHWNSGKKFGPQKTRIMGLRGSEDSLTIGLSRFDTIPACDGQTDRQTSSLYQ